LCLRVTNWFSTGLHADEDMGDRRWDCLRYDECLTRAALANAPGLHCRECSDFKPAPAMDTAEVKALAAACFELWAAVLDLERRDQEREREKAEREARRRIHVARRRGAAARI